MGYSVDLALKTDGCQSSRDFLTLVREGGRFGPPFPGDRRLPPLLGPRLSLLRGRGQGPVLPGSSGRVVPFRRAPLLGYTRAAIHLSTTQTCLSISIGYHQPSPFLPPSLTSDYALAALRSSYLVDGDNGSSISVPARSNDNFELFNCYFAFNPSSTPPRIELITKGPIEGGSSGATYEAFTKYDSPGRPSAYWTEQRRTRLPEEAWARYLALLPFLPVLPIPSMSCEPPAFITSVRGIPHGCAVHTVPLSTLNPFWGTYRSKLVIVCNP
jgi:hypothetical protein